MSQDTVRIAQGKRLAALRKAAGFRSARDAALQCGWSESSYRAHENGTRTIGLDDAERYARRFASPGMHSSAQQILFGKNFEQSENGKQNKIKDRILFAAWEASLQKLGIPDILAPKAAAEMIELLSSDIEVAPGLTEGQATRQLVVSLIQKYVRLSKP